MKLSTLSAKLTCMKSNAFRILAAGTVAAAALTMAAPAAQAQHIAVGLQFGGPAYGYAYAPAAPVYYGHDEWRERDRYIEAQRMRERRENEWREHELREHQRYDHDRYEHVRRGW